MSQHHMRPHLWLILFFALLVATGCRSEPTPLAVNEQVLATCSAECAARGQCGTLSSAARAVLANEAGPAVRFHDRFFAENALVSILAIRERQLMPAQDGIPVGDEEAAFPHLFYQVANSEGKTGWVSGWCVVRPKQ